MITAASTRLIGSALLVAGALGAGAVAACGAAQSSRSTTQAPAAAHSRAYTSLMTWWRHGAFTDGNRQPDGEQNYLTITHDLDRLGAASRSANLAAIEAVGRRLSTDAAVALGDPMPKTDDPGGYWTGALQALARAGGAAASNQAAAEPYAAIGEDYWHRVTTEIGAILKQTAIREGG